ncbi:MAG: ABC transporter permease [bacterium]|nr:ABC transporter permease [bacterium]
MTRLILANLRHRRTRSTLCVLAVGIGIALLLVLSGLCRGMIHESARRLRGTGASVIVQPRGSSGLLAFKGGSLPVRYAGELEAVEGVAAACPVLTWTTTIDRVIYVVYGVDLGAFEAVGGALPIVEGRPWRSGDELLVDSRLAAANGYRVGDRLPLLGRTFRVAGIFRSGVGARVYLPIETLQEALHLEGMCSLFFVAAEPGVAPAGVAAEIEARLPALTASVLDNYEEILVHEVTGLGEFFGVITGTALVISFLVILTTMYTTIAERTREIGILRALGATRGRIVRMVAAESLILCAMGVAAGFAIAVGVRFWLAASHPLLTMEITAAGLARAAALGIAGGVLGALPPGMRAARVDPVEALLYE